MKKGFIGKAATAALLVLAIAVAGPLAGDPGRAVGQEGATLSLTPASGEYLGPDVTFDVQIRLLTGTDAINAVQAYLTFPTDKLEVVGTPSISGSFLECWMPEVAVDPVAGTIHLVAGVPSGFEGGFAGDGLVATVTFMTQAVVGTAVVAFDTANCFVMRSSDNTNVLSDSLSGSYTIADHAPALLRLTGTMRLSGPRLEAEYELLADSVRIPLSTALVQSITRSIPAGGSEAVALDDASGNLWVDVLQATGTYSYTVLMQPSGGMAVSYLADLDWNPPTVSFGAGGVWTKQAGTMLIPYSCSLDLSTASAMAHFDASRANPTIDAVPATPGLLFSIAHPAGQYLFVVIIGRTLTFALLTQPRTGDLNHDGVVAIEDVSLLVAAWGPVQANNQADIDMNLTVDIFDVSILLSRWTPVG